MSTYKFKIGDKVKYDEIIGTIIYIYECPKDFVTISFIPIDDRGWDFIENTRDYPPQPHNHKGWNVDMEFLKLYNPIWLKQKDK